MFRHIRILYLEGTGTKKGRRKKERSEIEEEEFAIYDQVCHDQL
jgi:hypothetical protein